MSRTSVTMSVNNISGGEASIYPFNAMPSKYSMLMQNCCVGESGLVCKIPGYESIISETVSETLTTGVEYVKSNGTKTRVVAGGGKIYYDNDGVLAVIKTGLDTGARVFYSQINDLLIMTNGVNAPMKYDGATASTLGGSPPATAFMSHVHKNRVWMLDRTDKMMAYHSALNAPEDYTGAGSGYIDFKYVLKKGDELVDIITYIDLLVFIFKNHIAIYSGSTPSGTSSDFQLVQLIDGIGAVGTGVSVPLGTDIAIMTSQGVVNLKQAAITGSLNMSSLSESIEPTLRIAISTYGVICAAHYRKYGWLLFLIGGTIYCYSYIWKAWFKIVGADVNWFFTTTDGSLYITGTGNLYAYDSTWGFNGSNIEYVWDTAWLSVAKNDIEYAYPQVLEIMARPKLDATISMSIQYDLRYAMAENVTSFKLSSDQVLVDGLQDFNAIDPLDGILPYDVIRVPLFGRGKIMKIRFSNSSTIGPIELSGFSIISKLGRR